MLLWGYANWTIFALYGDYIDTSVIQSTAKPKASAQFKDKAAFLKALKPVVKEVAADLNISHKIILAQAVLESSWGKSVKGNNYLQ